MHELLLLLLLTALKRRFSIYLRNTNRHFGTWAPTVLNVVDIVNFRI